MENNGKRHQTESAPATTAPSSSAEGYRPAWGRWAPIRLICYVAGIALTAIATTILARLLVPPAPSPWHALVWIKNLALPVALFAVYARLVRALEHRRAWELDIRTGFSGMVIGALAGAAAIVSVVLLLWANGTAEIVTAAGMAGLAPALLMPLATSMGEELLFRVVLFGLLEEMFGSLVAVLGSAALFGLAHAANPGATPLALAGLSIALGAVTALAYMLTRNIWLPIGIHMGWNFAQGFVFGTLNSGVREPQSYFRTELSGPDVLTGGAFGLEGSLVTLVVGFVACMVLYQLIRRRGAWRPVQLQMRK